MLKVLTIFNNIIGTGVANANSVGGNAQSTGVGTATSTGGNA